MWIVLNKPVVINNKGWCNYISNLNLNKINPKEKKLKKSNKIMKI